MEVQDVKYEGGLVDGMFHGYGNLMYPMGQNVEGEWDKGNLVSYVLRFSDNLDYGVNWDYCKMPDRRFFKSIREGIHPAGRSILTNHDTARPIPEGCYDTGDGFYNPKIKCVISAEDTNKILRVPTASEEKWIIENCRKAWDEPTGYRPDLFEHWIKGRSTDTLISMNAYDVPTPPDSSLEILVTNFREMTVSDNFENGDY